MLNAGALGFRGFRLRDGHGRGSVPEISVRAQDARRLRRRVPRASRCRINQEPCCCCAGFSDEEEPTPTAIDRAFPLGVTGLISKPCRGRKGRGAVVYSQMQEVLSSCAHEYRS